MQKLHRFLYLLATLRLALPFILQDAAYQPHRDEFLYLQYGLHMDWGYMEVPPLLSVFSWLSQQMGNGLFWVKIWPTLFGSITFIMVGHLVLVLGGRWLAITLLFICFIAGAHLSVFFLFQPGFLEITSWTAIACCFIMYGTTAQKKWLLFFGMSCGLGMLAKYTTAFFITGCLIGIACTGWRKVFTNKYFYWGALLGCLLFLPNLYWQWSHHFPLISHMEELRATQLKYISPQHFLVDQLLMHLAIAFIWVIALLFLLFNKVWKTYQWYGIACLAVVGLLILGSGKAYYALGIYPVLFAFGVVIIEQKLQRMPAIYTWLTIAIPVIIGFALLPVLLPISKPNKLVAYYEKTGIKNALGFTWEDQNKHPLPQDFADMLGWKEMAAMTAKQYHQLPDSVRNSLFIYCRGYFSAGALNYYGPALGLPTVYSDNGSFLKWMPSTFPYKNLMLVAHNAPDATDEVFTHFASVQRLDTLQIPLARENGTQFFLFLKGDSVLQQITETGIAQLKAPFGL